MSKLDELHKAYLESKENDVEDFNYGEEIIPPQDNEFSVWRPVARNLEFEKHIQKLKAMKRFNEGR
jgi:hypothetical protein